MGKTIDNIAKAICLIFVIIGCIALIGVLFGGDDNTSNNVGNSQPTATPIPTVTIGDIKNSASPISYDELMRNSDNYVGEIVYKRGEIRQVLEYRNDKYVLQIATRQSEYIGYFDDVISVEYEGDRLLEGDIIDVWGISKGLKKFDMVIGGTVTVPEIDSMHVELVIKAGNNW